MPSLRFHWSSEPAFAQAGELVLTTDPLAQKPCAWFEDYFDYPRDFKTIYNAAKQKSSSWTAEPPFHNVRLLGTPYLDAFEHQVHSFWMQIERDTVLINNLIDREHPDRLVLTGRQPNPAAISACAFDPGLFEYTAAAIARERGIAVDYRGAPPPLVPSRPAPAPWFVRIIGAITAQLKAPAPSSLSGGPAVLVSPQVWLRIGPQLSAEAKSRSVTLICTEADVRSDVPTIYSLAGRSVSLFHHLAAYRSAMAAFRRIPASAWSAVFTRDSINYGPIAASFVRHSVCSHLWNECYRLLLLRKTIDRVRPKSLLVLYDHGLYEACSVQLCKSRGVKSVTLQHALFLPGLPTTFPIRSDIYAAWGSREKEVLVAQGEKGERIHAIGSVLLENFTVPSQEKRGDDTIKVLFATQAVQSAVTWYFGYPPVGRLVRMLVSSIGSNSRFALTLRPHPNETIDHGTARLAAQAGIAVDRATPLHKQIADHDVVVTQYSSTGVEALLAGKPLVMVNWVSNEEILPYASEGVAPFSLDPSDFPEKIETAINTFSGRRDAVERFLSCHVNRDKACARLFDLIISGR